ncbi:sugar-binding transcriptional regulator [Mesorhizobium sp. NZP2234]|uniref:sugar-binding transcriptional regulator n=1 Tax=Mesorhizobium sp. NZP2234 TaxID=2483402 RepID=UPI001555B358|nr:sugar-binding transcriptional regulator [Mesorhizobium sp. NZP2234]QKC92040.1 sugar-binding transcriptional regulator [Mesorhizobium sp. NZP2234]
MTHNEEDLLVQLAWLYYVGNKNQEEIANQLGLSRFKINRMLARAREKGLVKIAIQHETAQSLDVAGRIQAAFDLRECIVTPAIAVPGGNADEDENNARRAVGIAASSFLERRLRVPEPVTIGLAWGRTIAAMVDELPKLYKADLKIVSLMGSLSRNARTNPFDCVHSLAQLCEGEAYILPAPFIADSEADYQVIMSQKLVQQALKLARSADFYIASFGDCSKQSFIYHHDLLHDDEIDQVINAGAVADMLGKFFDKDGALLDNTLNRRTPSVSYEDIRSRDVVLLAAGLSKAKALVALLRSGTINRLIVDGDLAAGLLPLIGRG